MKLRQALNTITPYKPGVLKEGAIKLASNENPLGPSPRAMEYIRNNADSVYLYPDAACTHLSKKLADKHGVAQDQIIVGNGSDEILLFIAGAYIEPGSGAVTSECTFSEYTFSVTLFGGSLSYAPLINGSFDPKAIAALIQDNTKIVYICNPNNPTGTYITEKDFIRFMNSVPEHVLVVSDEAYCEYVEAADYPETIPLLKRYPNLLILRTFSKIYGLAGLRVGYGIGNAAVIDDLKKTKEPFNVNILAQGAAAAALDDTAFISASIKNNSEGKQYLYKELSALGLEFFRTEANFICFKIGQDCMKAFEQLMNLGVTIRPLRSFGLNEWIRVTIGTQQQNELFIRCLRRIL